MTVWCITDSILINFSVVYEIEVLKTKIPKRKESITLGQFQCQSEIGQCQFPRFPSFRFCPIPKIENSEISESFLLLIILVAYETENLKTDWKMTQNKKALIYGVF